MTVSFACCSESLSFFFFPVSPCRRLIGSAEKLQPTVLYKPQRSYNRSAIGMTRMFFNINDMHVDIYVPAKAAGNNLTVSCLQLGTSALAQSFRLNFRT